ADFTDAIGRKANRRLRIGANFIPAPSGGIHAKFVEQSRREGVVPDRRKRIIDLRVMEEVVLARRPVKETVRLWNPVDREGDTIICGDICVDAAVVLLFRIGGRAGGYVVRNVRHRTQAAANTGAIRAGPAGILRTQGCRQRRPDIQALARNRYAVYALGQTSIRAGGSIDARAD